MYGIASRYFAKEPRDGISGLGTDTQPVLGPLEIELNILVPCACLGCRVITSDMLDMATVSLGP